MLTPHMTYAPMRFLRYGFLHYAGANCFESATMLPGILLVLPFFLFLFFFSFSFFSSFCFLLFFLLFFSSILPPSSSPYTHASTHTLSFCFCSASLHGRVASSSSEDIPLTEAVQCHVEDSTCSSSASESWMLNENHGNT
jgi:hypothetical protein